MTAKTRHARELALDLIQLAQDNLAAAASVACDLQGWAEEWQAISDAHDATRALWHRCNEAPLPLGHDYEM